MNARRPLWTNRGAPWDLSHGAPLFQIRYFTPGSALRQARVSCGGLVHDGDGDYVHGRGHPCHCRRGHPPADRQRHFRRLRRRCRHLVDHPRRGRRCHDRHLARIRARPRRAAKPGPCRFRAGPPGSKLPVAVSESVLFPRPSNTCLSASLPASQVDNPWPTSSVVCACRA